MEKSNKAIEALRQQQEILSLAIQQRSKEPDVQNALRNQKDALGKEIDRIQKEKDALKNIKDRGGAYASNPQRAASKSLAHLAPKESKKSQ